MSGHCKWCGGEPQDGWREPNVMDEAAYERVCTAASLREAIADFEKAVLIAALKNWRWKKVKTSKSLGISLKTLGEKMRLYKLEKPHG